MTLNAHLGFSTMLDIVSMIGVVEEFEHGIRAFVPALPNHPWWNFLALHSFPDWESPAEFFWTNMPASTAMRHFAIGYMGADGPAWKLNPAAPLPMTMSDIVMQTRRLDQVDAARASTLDFASRDLDDATSIYCIEHAGLNDIGERARTIRRRLTIMQRLQAANNACWMGVHDDGMLIGLGGVVRLPSGTARFQSIATHPDHRRQGIASQVVSALATHARTAWRASSFVILANGSAAEAVYRNLGFRRVRIAHGIWATW